MANNKTARITAFIALVAIFGSVIWTWAMIIYQSITWTATTTQNQEVSQDQINDILKKLSNSWSTSSWTTSSGELQETQTWELNNNTQTWITN